MTSAFCFLAGQTSAQLPQPVQSSGATCMRKLQAGKLLADGRLGRRRPRARSACSSSSPGTGRMQACGQTSEHWLHWMQLSGIPLGNLDGDAALLVLGGAGGHDAVGVIRNAETGSLSPSCARMGWMTFVEVLGRLDLCTGSAPRRWRWPSQSGTLISLRPVTPTSMAA